MRRKALSTVFRTGQELAPVVVVCRGGNEMGPTRWCHGWGGMHKPPWMSTSFPHKLLELMAAGKGGVIFFSGVANHWWVALVNNSTPTLTQATMIKFSGSRKEEEGMPGRIRVSVGEGEDERVTGSRNDQIIPTFKWSRNIKITCIFSSEFWLS